MATRVLIYGRLYGVAFNIGIGTFSPRDDWISFLDHKVQTPRRWMARKGHALKMRLFRSTFNSWVATFSPNDDWVPFYSVGRLSGAALNITIGNFPQMMMIGLPFPS